MVEIMPVRACVTERHDVFDVQEVLSEWKKIVYCID